MKVRGILVLFLSAVLAAGCSPVSTDQEQNQDPTITHEEDTPSKPEVLDPPTEQEKQPLPPHHDPSNPKLDTVIIKTPNSKRIDSREKWVENGSIEIHYAGGVVRKLGPVDVKGRGNSTWWYVKKPYTIRLHEKMVLFEDWPAGKRFNLLANWMDRTLMRDAVAFEVARKTKSLDWTPRGHFVQLVLNGLPMGNYYLTEHINIDKDRIDAEGGWIVEFDTYYDQQYKFHSQYFNLPVNVKDPDGEDMNAEILKQIQDYINNVEAYLQVPPLPSSREYANLIDVDSFIDWWFVHEIANNGEPWHPKSCYFHKAPDGKMKAGPVWDFDWYTFIPDCDWWSCKTTIWYKNLLRDPLYKARVKKKWRDSLPDFESVVDFIDATAAEIHDSAIENCKQWPIDQEINFDENLSWEDAVARLRAAYIQRLKWMDKEMERL